MGIETFSFRYGTDGFMEWYRCEAGGELRLERFDGERRTLCRAVTAAEMEQLEEIIRTAGIAAWDGFCRMELGMCGGNAWALHVTYRDGTAIHAMGHSEVPAGFAAGRAALADFFGAYL